MDPIEIGGQTYRIERKLNGLKQLHVSRKLTPIVGQLVALAGGSESPAAMLRRELSDFVPVAEALAAMPEADVNFVIGTCLECVSRREPGGVAWMPIWSAAAGGPMYDDIDMMVMLRLTWAVVLENLRNFIPAGVLAGLPGVGGTSLP